MQLWKYFVMKDDDFDWTKTPGGNVASGAWATGRLHRADVIPPGVSPGGAMQIRDPQADAIVAGSLKPPTAGEVKEWVQTVHAMRSVSRRVLGHRPPRHFKKPADIDPLEADTIAARYISMLRPRLRTDRRPLHTFDRLVLEPSVPERVTRFGDGICVLWQLIFGSMIPGFGVPVCCDCGRTLPDSRTGKRSKAVRCRGCQYRHWKAQFPIDKWREIEAEKKARQRAKAKQQPNQ